MKKYLLVGITLLATTGAMAQKSKIRDARDYLGDKDYKKALVAINEAVNNEDTKNNAEAWYLRGMAYLQEAIDSTAHNPDAASESYNSMMKALAIKPDYSTEINNGLYSNALLAFNEGVALYGTNPSKAYEKFMRVVDIYKVGNGKRFASDKGFSDLVVSAKTNAAYSALNAKRDDDALAILNDIKATSPTKDSNVYQSLIDIYSRKGDDEKAFAVVTEARSQFPNSKLFRELEINYYIKQGKSDILAAKLDEALKTDPNNGLLWFNLANVYERSAFPKDATGKALPKPANFSEQFGKAENAYQNAVRVSPDNADYFYNYGVLYYEGATELTLRMNGIKGTSPAEDKEYKALMAERDAQFDKALPYFEKSFAILDPRASSLKHDEKVTYQNTMIGLREIYSRKDNKAKTDELKAKLQALR